MLLAREEVHVQCPLAERCRAEKSHLQSRLPNERNLHSGRRSPLGHLDLRRRIRRPELRRQLERALSGGRVEPYRVEMREARGHDIGNDLLLTDSERDRDVPRRFTRRVDEAREKLAAPLRRLREPRQPHGLARLRHDALTANWPAIRLEAAQNYRSSRDSHVRNGAVYLSGMQDPRLLIDGGERGANRKPRIPYLDRRGAGDIQGEKRGLRLL